MAAVCGYIGRTDKSPGLPWALPAARGRRRRAADLVQLPAPLRGPQRRLCSCEAPGVRGRARFMRSRAHAEQGSRSPGSQGWLNSPAGSTRCGRRPLRGFHLPPPLQTPSPEGAQETPRPRTPTPRAPRELLLSLTSIYLSGPALLGAQEVRAPEAKMWSPPLCSLTKPQCGW